MNAVIVDAVIVCSRGHKSPQPGSEEPWGGVAGGVVSLGDEEGEVSSTMEENNGGRAANDTISAGGGCTSRNEDHILSRRQGDARGRSLISDNQDGKGVRLSRQEERDVGGVNRYATSGICSSPFGVKRFRKGGRYVVAVAKRIFVDICVKHIQ